MSDHKKLYQCHRFCRFCYLVGNRKIIKNVRRKKEGRKEKEKEKEKERKSTFHWRRKETRKGDGKKMLSLPL